MMSTTSRDGGNFLKELLHSKMELGRVLVLSTMVVFITLFVCLVLLRDHYDCEADTNTISHQTVTLTHISSSNSHIDDSKTPSTPSEIAQSSCERIFGSESHARSAAVRMRWGFDEKRHPPLEEVCKGEPFPERTVVDDSDIVDNSPEANCLLEIPKEYEYPPDWPERRTHTVRWENFGKNAVGCLSWKGNGRTWYFTNANGSQIFNNRHWCFYATEEYLNEQRGFYQRILQHLPFICWKRIRSVLDIGGGVGDFALFLSEAAPHAQVLTVNGQFAQHTSKEPYVPFQEIISERGFLHLTHDATALPYPFAPRSFDMIFNKNFIRFIDDEDMIRMFFEWDRLVRPGGYIVFWVNAISEPEIDEGIARIAGQVLWKLVSNTPHLLVFVTKTS